MKQLTAALTIFVGISFNVSANFEYINIKNLNIDYTSPNGTAKVDQFEYGELNYTDAVMTVQREESDLNLVFDGKDAVVSGLSDNILDASPFRLRNLSFNSQGSKATLKIDESTIKSGTDQSYIQGFIMMCSQVTNDESEGEKYLKTCIKNSVMNLKSLNTSSVSVVKKLVHGLATERSNSSITDLRMQSVNNRLTFSMRMGLRLVGQGYIHYVESGNTKKIRMRIDKVKAGFFNVTKRLFNELGAIDLPENITVSRPYVTIDLD